MVRVRDVRDYLFTLAPEFMKMDWDHAGLLCGDPEAEVKRIMISLDPSENACKEAIARHADILLTHHPLIFNPPDSITTETSVGRCILLLASHGISAINAHTNLDQAPGGVNDVLVGTLGLRDVHVLNPEGNDAAGTPWGLLRGGIVEEQSLSSFLARVKTALSCPGLRYVDGGKPVHRVAVGGGSCGSGLQEVIDAGCDTFVTSDVKYNQFLDAETAGINLIDAGHFYTENPVCGYLLERIAAQFPETTVFLSETNRDPMKFF